jgi:hypothetical protein
VNTIRSHYPLAEDEDPTKWGAKIGNGLSAWVISQRFEAADEFIKMMDLEQFDDHLARIERLDAMIDRTIKRLMQRKAQKQMLRQLEPKVIKSVAAAAEWHLSNDGCIRREPHAGQSDWGERLSNICCN